MKIFIDTDFYDILKICKDLEELQEYLSPAKIDIIKTHDGRVLFTTNMFDTSVKRYKIRYQSRGLILDELDNTILSIPSKCHSHYNNIIKNDIKKLYDTNRYSVVKARDGTTITIYNFNGTYHISTGRSSDITHYYWNGNKTFAQMFYESAQSNSDFIKSTNLCLTDTGNIKWNIPPNYCVTLGFRHQNIHQNKNDPNNVWLIRCYDKDKHEDIKHPNLSSLVENEYEEEDLTWQKLIQKCNRPQKTDQYENFYGYILVAKPHLTDPPISIDLERVFIPSTLYQTLQHFFYSFHKNLADSLDHQNRYIYSIFRNILLSNQNFLKLLYELDLSYEVKVQKYENFINMVATKVCSRFQDLESNKDNIYDEFITEIMNKLKKDENDLDINDPNSYKLINDYVRNSHNAKALTDIYLKYEV